jgi:hypothetical protein
MLTLFVLAMLSIGCNLAIFLKRSNGKLSEVKVFRWFVLTFLIFQLAFAASASQVDQPCLTVTCVKPLTKYISKVSICKLDDTTVKVTCIYLRRIKLPLVNKRINIKCGRNAFPANYSFDSLSSYFMYLNSAESIDSTKSKSLRTTLDSRLYYFPRTGTSISQNTSFRDGGINFTAFEKFILSVDDKWLRY